MQQSATSPLLLENLHFEWLKELAFRDETEARRLQNVLDADEEAEHVSRRLAMERHEHVERKSSCKVVTKDQGDMQLKPL